MLSIFVVTFPFFALVLCGYLAARGGLLPLAAIPGLNTFVLYFALPCMLYRFGAQTPIREMLDPGVFFVYLLCALLMVGLAVFAARRAQLTWNDSAFGALVAAFPNTGFMGVPLLVALLGKRAAGPAIVTILVDLVITSSLCIALSRLDGAGSRGARSAAGQALKGVALNPMPWSILLGGLSSALALALPQPLMQTLDMLADAASPVALFTIGAVLARSRTNSSKATPLADYLPIAVAKLVLHPALVLAGATVAVSAGVPLDRFAITVMVLVACLPSASNVSMLAERFGADNGRIARIIMISTALSFLTFSAAVHWLR
ncbi:AEC family transporter [Lacisediminimonas profundi]|uniref:AEC family transporter n=1 Tax=Lacisediminimonas profundi TaxID=2603856 RepID=UPI00124B2B6E|nr:AEC family transporter [Lacisediminimonas profundi]